LPSQVTNGDLLATEGGQYEIGDLVADTKRTLMSPYQAKAKQSQQSKKQYASDEDAPERPVGEWPGFSGNITFTIIRA